MNAQQFCKKLSASKTEESLYALADELKIDPVTDVSFSQPVDGNDIVFMLNGMQFRYLDRVREVKDFYREQFASLADDCTAPAMSDMREMETVYRELVNSIK